MIKITTPETRDLRARREMFTKKSGEVYRRREGKNGVLYTVYSEVYPRREGKNGVLYVVYSRGVPFHLGYEGHFPMWLYDSQISQWFGNSDRWSTETNTHQIETRPLVDMTMCGTDTMRQIIMRGGYTQYTAKLVTRE